MESIEEKMWDYSVTRKEGNSVNTNAPSWRWQRKRNERNEALVEMGRGLMNVPGQDRTKET